MKEIYMKKELLSYEFQNKSNMVFNFENEIGENGVI